MFIMKLVGLRRVLLCVMVTLMVLILIWTFLSDSLFCGTESDFDPLAEVDVVFSSSLASMRSLEAYTHEEGVIFLKTHKTASSTLTSLFWRHLCENEGNNSEIRTPRNCFLPSAEHPGKTWDLSKKEDQQKLRDFQDQKRTKWPPNVWLHHARFTPSLMNFVQHSTRMISVVRRPSLRFVSAWHWYEHEQDLRVPLEVYARDMIEMREKKSLGVLDYISRGYKQYWHPFRYRTGLDATSEELTGLQDFHRASRKLKKDKFSALLRMIRRREMILLVADRFDESVLLLSKLFEWKVPSYLIYSRLKEGKTHAPYSNRTLVDLDTLQPYDYALWRLANQLLTQTLYQFYPLPEGPGQLAQDLKSIRVANQGVHAACTNTSLRGVDSIAYNKGKLEHLCSCLARDNNQAVRFTRTALEGALSCANIHVIFEELFPVVT